MAIDERSNTREASLSGSVSGRGWCLIHIPLRRPKCFVYRRRSGYLELKGWTKFSQVSKEMKHL
jgi:hypothetical protein